MTGPGEIVHRLNVEGADLLALSGVNDANLHSWRGSPACASRCAATSSP